MKPYRISERMDKVFGHPDICPHMKAVIKETGMTYDQFRNQPTQVLNAISDRMDKEAQDMGFTDMAELAYIFSATDDDEETQL